MNKLLGSTPSSSVSQKICDVWNEKIKEGELIIFINDKGETEYVVLLRSAKIEYGTRCAIIRKGDAIRTVCIERLFKI